MQKEQIIQEVVKITRRYLPEKKYQIFLFGSWVKNRAAPFSDLDIGILGKEKIDEIVFMRVRNEIAAIPTLRRIDLVDLQNVDDKFKQGILKYAKQL